MKKIADFIKKQARTTDEIKKEIHELTEYGKRLNKLQNEGKYGYDNIPHDKIDKLVQELEQVNFKENWSLEQTIEKQKKWNEAIKAIIKDGGVHPRDLAKVEKALGHNVHELKKAVAYYKSIGKL